jgi:hypothetical protein
MTLIETFRNETAEELGATPSSDQSDGPNMLYFPTGLGFGKLRALPSADDVEFPERDLADKLVGLPPGSHDEPHPVRLSNPVPFIGSSLFRSFSLPFTRSRQAVFLAAVPDPHG